MSNKKTSLSPMESAEQAHLHYVTDDSPGVRRVRCGRGFRYVDARGQAVRDESTLRRIESLVIPPAWKEVWICADPLGHLQASGRDARGRKQQRYHPRWREARDETKFHRMAQFAKALPKIRRAVSRDLKQAGMGREKILAAVVRLLEKTHIRVGNAEYARRNGHFGLTTLHNRHADVKGADVHFEFKGKSGVRRTVDLHEQRLARIIRNCQDLPGHELFQYLDAAGERHAVTSTDVNDYLRRIAGEEFTAKDFRTWAGTLLAARTLLQCPPPASQRRGKQEVVRAVDEVAQCLGNTRAVCRKCYIHPKVLEAYLEGSLGRAFEGRSHARGVVALIK